MVASRLHFLQHRLSPKRHSPHDASYWTPQSRSLHFQFGAHICFPHIPNKTTRGSLFLSSEPTNPSPQAAARRWVRRPSAPPSNSAASSELSPAPHSHSPPTCCQHHLSNTRYCQAPSLLKMFNEASESNPGCPAWPAGPPAIQPPFIL